MKPILKHILIPATSAIAGGLIVLGAIKLNPSLSSNPDERHRIKQNVETVYDNIFKKHDGIRNDFDRIFSDDLFLQSDPFDKMRKMREEMERRIESMNIGRQHSTYPFDSWFSDKFGGGTVNDISRREDDDSVYYDIKVEDINSTSINSKVENGYITITGTTEKKSGSSDKKENDGFFAQSVYKSTFNRTFPLPEHVDQTNMQMTSEKDKIVLKFPKVKI